MRVCLIGYDFSSFGGIEQVSLQLLEILINNNIKYKIIKYRWYHKYMLDIILMIDNLIYPKSIYIFMHAYIYQRHSIIRNSIVWAHGIEVWGNSAKKKNTNLNKSKLILAVSTYTKERLKEVYGELPIKTVNLSVNTSRYTEEISKKTNDTFSIITVARLSSNEKYKGHDLTIRALKKIKDEHNLQINYNIVGKGDDTLRLKALTEELQIEDQVRFFGYVPDDKISSMYYNSHIFVMPSRVVKSDSQMWGGEGFGLVYLEAGLHKLPVIACDEGGQVDCIVDGYTGFLIKPEVSMLADKILQLHNDSNMREIMGENGHKHVTSGFSHEKFENSILNILSEFK